MHLPEDLLIASQQTMAGGMDRTAGAANRDTAMDVFFLTATSALSVFFGVRRLAQ